MGSTKININSLLKGYDGEYFKRKKLKWAYVVDPLSFFRSKNSPN